VIDMRAHRTSLHQLTRALALAVAIFSVALAGCAGVEVLGNDSTLVGTGGNGGGVIGGGGTGGGTQASAMVGQWTRAIFLEDANGNVHESRTTWEFRADGSAIRYVTAWNWTAGIYDTISSVAQWTTNGSTVTITYIAGATGTLSLGWRVDGDILTLGPDQFARVR
jgi:hypothetical protein